MASSSLCRSIPRQLGQYDWMQCTQPAGYAGWQRNAEDDQQGGRVRADQDCPFAVWVAK